MVQTDDSYFNDLSQQPPGPTEQQQHSGDNSPIAEIQRRGSGEGAGDNEGQPRAKRIACVLCRKRKLRCDGARPKCGTCTRLSHECGYDEVRKKSGPKRGYVKALEQRLQQVETLLKTQDHLDPGKSSAENSQDSIPPISLPQSYEIPHNPGLTPPGTEQDVYTLAHATMGSNNNSQFPFMDTTGQNDSAKPTEPYPWEMIGLGLEEPLPIPEAINELHDIYFEKIHPSIPMIHRPRYLTAMNLAPSMRPPICLRYIIWCHAASVSDKYDALADIFYQRSRKYAEMDEMKGHGESIITLAHCQTWVLSTLYEFKQMYFPRAWQSAGRGVRLALMMGLNRLDGTGLDVKQCLPPPKDWTEKEERRRTFWIAFSSDRYASIGTGWPMSIDERDIMTLLPSSEEAFEKSRPMVAPSLPQAFSSAAVTQISALSGVILITCLLGRNLTHLHRPTPHDNDEDLNGAFWRRHRELEGMLSTISLALPDHLRLPAGLPDPNVIFMNMLLQTSVICLHQAAIFKADKNNMPPTVIMESRSRCITGAAEIGRIMRMMSHLDLSRMNPFLAFCLYVAARVFVQYLKWKPNDVQMNSTLQFLLAAMHALKRKNPLTESFLAQLEVDLDGTGIQLPSRSSMSSKGPQVRCAEGPARLGILIDPDCPPAEIPVNTDAVKCSPLFEIRESQNGNVNNAAFHGKDFAHGAPEFSSTVLESVHAQVNLDMEATYGSFSGGDGSQFHGQLPSRSKDNPLRFGSQSSRQIRLVDSTSPLSSDMDCSNEAQKSRSNSYRDSSSHTSFTPPSQDELQTPYPNNLSKNSPSTLDSASGVGTPGLSNASDASFYASADATFSNFQQSMLFPGSPMALNASWDMSGIDLGTSGASAGGMTADASWNDMMSNVQGWNSIPPEQLFEHLNRQTNN